MMMNVSSSLSSLGGQKQKKKKMITSVNLSSSSLGAWKENKKRQ
jgi:hypothetical protein